MLMPPYWSELMKVSLSVCFMFVLAPALMLVVLLGLGVAPASAFAATPDGEPRNGFLPNTAAQRDRDDPREQAEPRISRREASEIAQQNFPGKVVSIQLANQRWRVRVDQDGRVFDVFVDVETGRVTRPSEGN